jgi:hypothetical protein
VRRIFLASPSSSQRPFCERGGELHGGFWQQDLPTEDLRIEGERAAVVAYSSVLLRLLYCGAGVQPPEGDLYADIDGLSAESAEWLISALMFLPAGTDEIPAPALQEARKRGLLPKGMKLKTMLSAIRKRHAHVAHMLPPGTEIGQRLLKRQTDILVSVLLRCRELDIVALPLYSENTAAIAVKETLAQEARRIMLNCFEEATGFEGAAMFGIERIPGKAAFRGLSAFDCDDGSADWN